MKKLVFLITILLGIFVSTYARTSQETNTVQTFETMQQPGGTKYIGVRFDDLNPRIQATIDGYRGTYTVKALEYCMQKKLTRVTLVSKADKKERIVILDEAGTKVEDEYTKVK